MKRWQRVMIESPFAGDVELNRAYLAACMRDAIFRGEAPFASHGLYTLPGVLRDEFADERTLGIEAGFAWRPATEVSIFCLDLGWSRGMREGLLDAQGLRASGHLIVERYIGHDWHKSYEPRPANTNGASQRHEVEKRGVIVLGSD